MRQPPGRRASLALLTAVLVGVAACAGPAPDPPEVSADATAVAVSSTDAEELLRAIDEVYAAEMSGSSGSLAKAYAGASLGLLEGDPQEVAARYLRTCSVGVTARDLALMGATLANGGLQPLTRERVASSETTRGVLSAMITAGMYDDSGPWYFRVGLPTKSGVSGGLLAVAPGCLAIAVYSPPLDEFGNSVRGQAVIEWLAARWGLHDLDRLLSAGRSG